MGADIHGVDGTSGDFRGQCAVHQLLFFNRSQALEYRANGNNVVIAPLSLHIKFTVGEVVLQQRLYGGGIHGESPAVEAHSTSVRPLRTRGPRILGEFNPEGEPAHQCIRPRRPRKWSSCR